MLIRHALRAQRGIAVESSARLRYGIAGMAVLVALGARVALDPVLGTHAPYLPFTVAIIVAARFGGRGPGLVSTGLSVLGVLFFFVEPRHSLVAAYRDAAAGLLLFAGVGCLISLLVGQLSESLLSTARAEAALRRKTQLVDLSHDAIITADSTRHITGWNAGAVELYGWTEVEAMGQVTHDLLKTTSRISTADVDTILHREGRWDGELQHIARDGRRVVVGSRHVLLRDEENRPIGILEINRDVTARWETEQDLRRTGEQYRLALESANLGAWEYHVDTRSLSWDQRCAAIFGESKADVIRYDEFIARIHPDDRAATDEAVRQAIAGTSNGEYSREYRVVWPDGSVHWVAVHGRVSFEGEGDRRRAVRLLGVSMEITARRRAEQRLFETQKLESIGLLAGGVAHDFNNLLTVIIGHASLVRSEYPVSDHPTAILAAAERAAYLTRQLLAYAGTGQVAIGIVDLTELVSQSAGLLAASVPKRTRLNFNLAQGLPCLEADRSRLEQVLLNLVTNSGEAIGTKRDGLIEVSTSCCHVTPEMASQHSGTYDVAADVYVCLKVRDDGAGMDDATLSRIFDPFFSTRFAGRGLGLAAVQGIVRTSRGFIEVQTSPGAGSTFQVFLPASSQARRIKAAAGPLKQPRSGGFTILVVDDEEMVRKLVDLTLTNCGYRVLEAEDGKKALQVLASAPSLPDLVLLDMAMPSMGGDELVPILEKEYPGLKIIISSGYADEDTPKGLASESIVGFLQKPYDVATLKEKVEAMLRIGR